MTIKRLQVGISAWLTAATGDIQHVHAPSVHADQPVDYRDLKLNNISVFHWSSGESQACLKKFNVQEKKIQSTTF